MCICVCAKARIFCVEVHLYSVTTPHRCLLDTYKRKPNTSPQSQAGTLSTIEGILMVCTNPLNPTTLHHILTPHLTPHHTCMYVCMYVCVHACAELLCKILFFNLHIVSNVSCDICTSRVKKHITHFFFNTTCSVRDCAVQKVTTQLFETVEALDKSGDAAGAKKVRLLS